MTGLRFGVQIFPYHRTDHHPAVQLEEDLMLIEHLDRYNFDEVWVGEHHSTGWQNIAQPELLIAAAAQRTKRIKLGTGVTSIPYHHPFLLADRMVQLDLMLRGRLMWGLGSGSLAQDASILGLDPLQARRMTEEGTEAILALLCYDGPISRKSDWFEINEGSLHLPPYNLEMDIRVASMASPSGPILAGKYGLGIFQFGVVGGDNPLARTWRIAQETAEQHGTIITRDRWSVLQNMHIAETEEQARKEARWGLQAFVNYVSRVVPFFNGDTSNFDALVDKLNESVMVIGTPAMAADRIAAILDQSGGIGTMVIGNTEIADPAATRRSYEILAREVVPKFTGHLEARRRGDAEMVRFGETAEILKAAQDKARAEYETRTQPQAT